MFDYLINHALKNVWCTPNQDKQMIVQPAKLTPAGGVWNKVKVLWRTHVLPLQATRFHVYQIGQLFPSLMGLFESDNEWTTFAVACGRENLIVDIYDENGIQLPRTQVWYMCTPDKDLILAIKDQENIPIDLNTSKIYLRVYSNAYYGSIQSDPLNDFIEVGGSTVRGNEDILALQLRFNQLNALPGSVYAFVNGLKVSGIDLFTAKQGDVVEYVYDSSIYTVIDLVIGELETFISTLDAKHKYLVHYVPDNIQSIDYHDDIDFFIINKDEQNRHKGIYYHRNKEDAVRMVTHKDYSITVPYAAGYVSSVPGWTDVDKLVLRLHIRKSGYLRSIVFENNRIEELYKLTNERMLDALVGTNSTVPTWTAAALENSAYAEVMRSNMAHIDRQLVESAYGYNAISKLIADTPMHTETFSSLQRAVLPYNLVNTSTVYEYDDRGVMSDYFPHHFGSEYIAYISSTKLIEVITGDTKLLIDEYYGYDNVILDPVLEYRMYTCRMVGGLPFGKYTDVTNTANYTILNNVLRWNVDENTYACLVRSNKVNLGYDLYLKADDGLLEFSLEQNIIHAGTEVTQVMQVPMGELDVFLNGYSLIEDLDYIVNFPKIVIINKAYLNDPLVNDQKVTIRFSGFCNSDLSRDKVKDTGFIKYGLLSHNNRYDIRDDKVMRIVVGGKLYARSELEFSESDPGVTVPNVINGIPYSIRDIVVPMRGLAVHDTYALRSSSMIIDKSISDYMTLWSPEIQYNPPNTIEAIYEVFSPFCCKIIYDLKAGLINDDILKHQYNDSDVMKICKEYEYLLEYDPTQNGLELDSNYVVVHPHNLTTVINLDIYSYKFLTRVVKLYLHGAVDISHFVSISVY